MYFEVATPLHLHSKVENVVPEPHQAAQQPWMCLAPNSRKQRDKPPTGMQQDHNLTARAWLQMVRDGWLSKLDVAALLEAEDNE